MSLDASQEPKLTPKQHAFLSEYFRNGSKAPDAYAKAYDASNMQPNTIKAKAYELLKSPRVAAVIENAQRKAAEKVGARAKSAAPEAENTTVPDHGTDGTSIHGTNGTATVLDYGTAPPSEVPYPASDEYAFTIDDMAREFDENRAEAIKRGQMGAAASSSAAKARLLFGDRSRLELVDKDGRNVVDVDALVRALMQRRQVLDGEVIDADVEALPALEAAQPAPRMVRHLPFPRRTGT